VGLPRRHPTLQAGGQELLVGPRLGAGGFGQRGTASRRVGAFNARVRNDSSLAMSRPGRVDLVLAAFIRRNEVSK
jgi:hypothetical protein